MTKLDELLNEIEKRANAATDVPRLLEVIRKLREQRDAYVRQYLEASGIEDLVPPEGPPRRLDDELAALLEGK